MLLSSNGSMLPCWQIKDVPPTTSLIILYYNFSPLELMWYEPCLYHITRGKRKFLRKPKVLVLSGVILIGLQIGHGACYLTICVKIPMFPCINSSYCNFGTSANTTKPGSRIGIFRKSSNNIKITRNLTQYILVRITFITCNYGLAIRKIASWSIIINPRACSSPLYQSFFLNAETNNVPNIRT